MLHAGIYATALVAGALAIASALHAVHLYAVHLPQEAVGVVAVTSAVVAAIFPHLLPSSPWRVPRSWARFGRPYAAIFGFALGTGILTALPSVSFYTLLTWGLAASWPATWSVFVLFALARATPLFIAAIPSAERDPIRLVGGGRNLAAALAPVEGFLLLALAVILLI
jgi:hypothetical protein